MFQNKGNRTNENINQLKHIAIIMDGNGRWAKSKGLPRIAGHKYGVNVIKNIMNYCKEIDVKILTLFAFSSENWKRPHDEVSHLMNLFLINLKNEIDDLNKKKTCLRIIGHVKELQIDIKNQISYATRITKDNKEFFLNIAINYGGKWDIIQACKSIAKDISDKKIVIDDINENLFENNLSLNELPKPDLFIRTGGEKRISNFLLWQLAYAEYYFTDTLWPDFNEKHLKKAILDFHKRKRKFGHITD
jgi:undecaprenyl diphosphate synthase